MRKQIERIELLEVDIEKNQSNFQRMRIVEAKKPCLSVYSRDSRLYRGFIECVDYSKNVAVVNYVDYGNTEDVCFEK